MKCENIQFNLSIYTDGILTTEECVTIDEHLAQCPLCRQKLSDFQVIRNNLRVLSRAAMPNDLLISVRKRVAQEVKAEKREPKTIFTNGFREWLQMQFMPYGIATVVTLVFGLSLLWTLLSAANRTEQNTEIAKLEPFAKSTVLLDDKNSAPADLNSVELSAADYASARISVSSDSPSLNPKGALIALTKSLVRGNMKDDEVVVVADVFGSGLAQISEVIEPSSDRRAVSELQNALQNDSDYAPFVPANLDGRSDIVRVVLKIQRVDVQTHSKMRRH